MKRSFAKPDSLFLGRMLLREEDFVFSFAVVSGYT